MNANDDLALTLAAASFAAIKHRHQRRKNGDIPYVNHPLEVARILSADGGVRDGATLAAAILHDTVEDTDTTIDELERKFGAKIAGIVAEVTDDKQLTKVERKRLQVEHAPRMTDEARLVKLADKIHNLRDLAIAPPPAWSDERIQGYFCWAYHVVQALGDVNPALERIAAEVFAGEFAFADASVPRLPGADSARRALLDRYYRQMEGRP